MIRRNINSTLNSFRRWRHHSHISTNSSIKLLLMKISCIYLTTKASFSSLRWNLGEYWSFIERRCFASFDTVLCRTPSYLWVIPSARCTHHCGSFGGTILIKMPLSSLFKKLDPLYFDFLICDRRHYLFYLLCKFRSVLLICKLESILYYEITVLVHNKVIQTIALNQFLKNLAQVLWLSLLNRSINYIWRAFLHA